MDNVSDSYEEEECVIKEECMVEDESLDCDYEESARGQTGNLKEQRVDEDEDSFLMNNVALNQENEEMVEECEPFAVVYVSSEGAEPNREGSKSNRAVICNGVAASRTSDRVRLPTTRYLESERVSNFMNLSNTSFQTKLTYRTQAGKRQARATERQLDAMVDYLFKHPHLASGKAGSAPGGRHAQGSWQELAKKLNSMFPAGKSKDVDSWKTTWRDNKTKVSGKYSSMVSQQKSSSDTEKSITLSEREWKTMELLRRNVVRCLKNAPPSGNEVDQESERKEVVKVVDVIESLPESTTQSDVIVEEIHNNFEDSTFEGLESPALMQYEEEKDPGPGRKRKHEEPPTTSKFPYKGFSGLTHERLKTQLSFGRDLFADLVERNVQAIEELAKAQNKLADVMLILAETQKTQTETLKKIVEREENHSNFLSKLRSVLN